MLDPITALSLVGTIVQFLDFGSRILSDGVEIYRNGPRVETRELETVTNDLSQLTSQIQSDLRQLSTSSGKLTPDDEALRKLSEYASSVAMELLGALNDLKVSKRGGRLGGIYQALKTALGKDKIDAIVQRLGAFRSELELRILVDLRRSAAAQAARNDVRFTSLAADLQATITTILDGNAQIATVSHEGVMTAIAVLSLSGSCNVRSNASAIQIPTTRTMAVEDVVLEKLTFRYMYDREANVTSAHHDTFRWILEDAAPQETPWSNLMDFLRTGNSIYWICGKAASGKSTLMKWLIRQPEVTGALNQWAGANRVTVLSFYFWNTGTELQRSQTGLLRSLLHVILSGYRCLIQPVLPGFYNQVANLAEDERSRIAPLSAAEVELAFLKTVELLPEDARLCLFIDGIDEYEGDHTDIVELLKTVASPKVKMVLSSRPIRECVFAFENFPRLRLEDLTRGDMRTYVDYHIAKYCSMPMCSSPVQSEKLKNLIEEIVTKSSGVFLWVFLVVKSLVKGLKNFDHITELRQRLNEFPTELDRLYKHMMERMDPLYRIQASKYLQIVLRSSVVQTKVPMSLLQMSFAESNALLIPPNMDIALRCRSMEARLTSRCCGLVETRNVEPTATVNFLHKSVVDFLRQPQIWDYVTNFTKGTHFSAELYLIRSILWVSQEDHRITDYKVREAQLNHRFKTKTLDRLTPKWEHPFFDPYMRYSRSMEMVSKRTEIALLDEFVQYTRNTTEDPDLQETINRFEDADKPLAACIIYGLRLHYLKKVETWGPACFQTRGTIALLVAACPYAIMCAQKNDCMNDLELIITDLAQNGADPNSFVSTKNDLTCFQLMLTGLEQCWVSLVRKEKFGKSTHEEVLSSHLRILSILIHYGADVNCVLTGCFTLSGETKLPCCFDTRSALTVVQDVGTPSNHTKGGDNDVRLNEEIASLKRLVIQQLIAKGAKALRVRKRNFVEDSSEVSVERLLKRSGRSGRFLRKNWCRWRHSEFRWTDSPGTSK